MNSLKRIGCMFPGCQKIKRNRGCCSSHYTAFLKQVLAGETTWKKLEDDGVCEVAKVTPMRSNINRVAKAARDQVNSEQ